jgi:hypothetical protein
LLSLNKADTRAATLRVTNPFKIYKNRLPLPRPPLQTPGAKFRAPVISKNPAKPINLSLEQTGQPVFPKIASN